MKRLFLVDGSSFVYRSYYALPELRTKEGIPTGAVYGFITMLQGLLGEYQPQYLIVAFDRPEPTFRHQNYTEYKKNRISPPEDLILQLPWIKEILEAMRIPSVEQAGVEADDLIGSLCAQAVQEEDLEVLIVTGDKDLLQLVRPQVKVLQSHFKNSKLYDEEEVARKYRCQANCLPDLFGLMGDQSDNIPGVPGIGVKTAGELIEHYGNLEGLYQHLDEVKGKRQEVLRENEKMAFLSRDLARIKTDVDIELSLDQAQVCDPDYDRLTELYKRLEFRKLLSQITPLFQQLPEQSRSYEIISSVEALENLCNRLVSSGKLFALDTETTGLDPMKGKLVGISIAVESGVAYYLPIGHSTGANLNWEEVRNHLGPVLNDERISKCGHHLKFDSAFLKQAGLPLKGIAFDTLVASYLIEPEADSHKLDNLALDHLKMGMTPIEQLIGKGRSQISMADVPIAQVGPYACEDADATYQLYRHYRNRIEKEEAADLFFNVEIPLIDVLREMELTGVEVDESELNRQSEELANQIRQIEKQVISQAGVKFNLNSPKQLAEVLYDKLKLPSGRKRSTAVDVLEKLAADGLEIASSLIEYRQLTKLKSTYLDALPAMIHPVTGRIHTSYHQTGAATGRISSSDPNLQNIPIRTDLGKRIRKAFKASEGQILLSADYSQIELRILAHLAEDPGLIQAFLAGEDIHSYTAREIFGLDKSQPVSGEFRRQAKAINFGLNYGMTPYGLAQRLGISNEAAQDYMKRYFARYPRVLEYVKQTQEIAQDQGYIRTLMGRRIPTLGVRSSNRLQKDAALRAAINAPIQGTAADLLKLAMVQSFRMIQNQALSSKMILTVHDEIIFEVPHQELELMKERIKEVMESVTQLRVPLKVDLAWGATWADL